MATRKKNSTESKVQVTFPALSQSELTAFETWVRRHIRVLIQKNGGPVVPHSDDLRLWREKHSPQGREQREKILNFEAELYEKSVREQPELAALQERLLQEGGERVAFLSREPALNLLLRDGRGYTTDNTSAVELEDRLSAPVRWWNTRGMIGLFAAYALFEDEVWRSITCGLQGDTIIDDIRPKQRYFGVVLDFDQSFKRAAKRPYFASDMVKTLIQQGSTFPSVVRNSLEGVAPGDKEDAKTKADNGQVFFETAVAYLRQATSPAVIGEAATEVAEVKDGASKAGAQGS